MSVGPEPKKREIEKREIEKGQGKGEGNVGEMTGLCTPLLPTQTSSSSSGPHQVKVFQGIFHLKTK